MSKAGGAPITSSNKESLKDNGRYKTLYKSLKLLLYDEKGFRQLCDMDDNGVYRDMLEMRLRQWIRPLTRKDAHDYITNLVSLGVFDTVIETIERTIPVEQLRRKSRKRPSKAAKAALEVAIERFEPEFRALIPNDIEIPRNSELVGFTRMGLAVFAIVRFWKVKLVPTKVLKEICCKEFYVCESS